MFAGAKQATQQARDAVKESLTIMDKFLEDSKWIAGDNLTIADFSALTTITTIVECGYDLELHKNLNRWYKQCQSLPGFDENLQGARGLAAFLNKLIDGSVF